MSRILANGLLNRNSHPHVRVGIASGYSCQMRGAEKQRRRAANLRLLQRQWTLRRIADDSGTDEVYLSQIANEYVGKGRKSPRTMSDDYATKIEIGFGLPDGWMDQDNEGTNAVAEPADRYAADAPITDDIDALLSKATPGSQAQLRRIAQAAADGKLSDADVRLLEQIAKHLAEKD